jgi:hypothetical protein
MKITISGLQGQTGPSVTNVGLKCQLDGVQWSCLNLNFPAKFDIVVPGLGD